MLDSACTIGWNDIETTPVSCVFSGVSWL